MTLLSINFLQLTVPEIQPGQDFKGQGYSGNFKSQIKSTSPPLHTYTPTYVPAKYQHLTPHSF